MVTSPETSSYSPSFLLDWEKNRATGNATSTHHLRARESKAAAAHYFKCTGPSVTYGRLPVIRQPQPYTGIASTTMLAKPCLVVTPPWAPWGVECRMLVCNQFALWGRIES